MRIFFHRLVRDRSIIDARMPRPLVQCADRLTAALPGWLLLLGGLSLLGLMLLTPAWVQNREIAWQRDVMRLQTQHLERQQQRYQDFQNALAMDDPILLERLAFAQLRQKPVGQELLLPTGDGQADVLEGIDAAGSIDAWLWEKMPEVGQEIPPYQPLDTRLTRLAQGERRLFVMTAGLLCAAGGLWMGAGRQRPGKSRSS